MVFTIIDDCGLTRYLYSALIKDVDKDSRVYTYSSIKLFLEDLHNSEFKMMLPDYILTDSGAFFINALDLIDAIDEFKSKYKYASGKLATYIVSMNMDIPSLVLQLKTKQSFKGFLIKPLREDHIKTIINKREKLLSI